MIRKPPLSSLQLAALAAPVLAILILLVFTIGSNVAASREAKRVNQGTEFIEDLTVLVHELQEERDRTAGQAASGRDKPAEDLVGQRQQADQAVELWRDALGELPRDAYGKPLRDALAAATGDLTRLAQHRKRIDAGELPKFLDATKYYIDLIGHLLVVVDRIADETTDPALRTSLRTVSALAWSKENASQGRGLLNWMLTEGDDGVKDEASRAMLAQMSGAEFTWLVQFRVAAPKSQEELFEQVVSGDELNKVGDLRARAISQPERLAGVKASEWMDSATTKADLMREVEQRLVDKAKADAASARSAALKGAVTGTMPTLLVLLVAAGGAFLLTRSLPQQGPAPRARSVTDGAYEPARWPDEEPAARLGGAHAVHGAHAGTEVLRPFDQPATGPQPAFGPYDQPLTGPQPVMGPGQRWPGPMTGGAPTGGAPTGGWPVQGAAEGPSGQWPAMPRTGGFGTGEWPAQAPDVPDDRAAGVGSNSWPGMTPQAEAPTPPPGSWEATPAGGPATGAPTAAGDWRTRPAPQGRAGGPGAGRVPPQDARDGWAPTGGDRAQRSWPPGAPRTPGAMDAGTARPAGWQAGAPSGQQPGGGLPRRSTAGERLPIFEETRYDWFRTGGNQAAGTRDRSDGDWSDLLVGGTADPSRLFGDPAGISEGEPTPAGLPRRRQGASMASGLAGNGTAHELSPLGSSVRSPDDLRAALDSYQSGFERGKQEAMRWFKNMPGGATS